MNRKARRRQCIIINKGLWVGNGVWVRSRLHYLPQTSSVNTKPKVTANAFDSVRQGPIPGNDAPKRWQPWVRCFAVPCCIGLAFVASRRIPFRFPTFLATTKKNQSRPILKYYYLITVIEKPVLATIIGSKTRADAWEIAVCTYCLLEFSDFFALGS